jgi:hypothetical protein
MSRPARPLDPKYTWGYGNKQELAPFSSQYFRENPVHVSQFDAPMKKLNETNAFLKLSEISPQQRFTALNQKKVLIYLIYGEKSREMLACLKEIMAFYELADFPGSVSRVSRMAEELQKKYDEEDALERQQIEEEKRMERVRESIAKQNEREAKEAAAKAKKERKVKEASAKAGKKAMEKGKKAAGKGKKAAEKEKKASAKTKPRPRVEIIEPEPDEDKSESEEKPVKRDEEEGQEEEEEEEEEVKEKPRPKKPVVDDDEDFGMPGDLPDGD